MTNEEAEELVKKVFYTFVSAGILGGDKKMWSEAFNSALTNVIKNVPSGKCKFEAPKREPVKIDG